MAAKAEGPKVAVDGLPDEFEADPNDMTLPPPEGDVADMEAEAATETEEAPEQAPEPSEPEDAPEPTAAPDEAETVYAQLAEAQGRAAALEAQMHALQSHGASESQRVQDAAESQQDDAARQRLTDIEREIPSAAGEGDVSKERLLMFERDRLLRDMQQRENSRIMRSFQEKPAQSSQYPSQPTEQESRAQAYHQFCGANGVTEGEKRKFQDAAPKLIAADPSLNYRPMWEVMHKVLRSVREPARASRGKATVESGSRRASTRAPFDPGTKWSDKDMERAANLNGTTVQAYRKLLEKAHG